MDIYSATQDGPVVVLMGEGRAYAIGDTAYVFRRQQRGLTLPRFARGVPVFWCDDEWKECPTGTPIIRKWGDKVTTIDAFRSRCHEECAGAG